MTIENETGAAAGGARLKNPPVRSTASAYPGGIYIHVPFCIRKCAYCDFYSTADLSLKDAFVAAVEQEIRRAGPSSMTFDTLYIGGGTPSVLSADQIARMVAAVRQTFGLAAEAEITIEANPGTIGAADLDRYQKAGIGRINLGIQSFNDENLKFLGRIHSARAAEKVLREARQCGFEKIGLDLIFGLPGQGQAAWLADLDRAVGHRPEHLSCYMLTYESGTPLDRARQKGLIRPLSDDRVAELFETTMAFLADHGYQQYEISNFARSVAARSRHNLKYWHFAPYLGFGPAAHSFVDPRRWWNHSDVWRYLERIARGRSPVAAGETLDRDQQMIEALYLGLRTTAGIDLAGFADRFGTDFTAIFGKLTGELAGRGLLRLADGRCALTRPGMLLLDSIVGLFVGQV